MASQDEIQEAFALFDKKGEKAIPRSSVGELLRALGQNPTQAEVQELESNLPSTVDFHTFTSVYNRPGGNKPAGSAADFIRGFQVFDKDGSGRIGVGELRYVLTSLGEKLTDEEVDELLKGVRVDADGNINYEQFVRQLLGEDK